MWKMLQQSSIEDLVIATGEQSRLNTLWARAFSIHGLDWRDHVRTEASLLRPSDILCSRADPSRARAAIGWRASVDIDGVIERMSAAALEQVDSRSLG
jgi:GDPmannose 4,6-dehydratase